MIGQTHEKKSILVHLIHPFYYFSKATSYLWAMETAFRLF